MKTKKSKAVKPKSKKTRKPKSKKTRKKSSDSADNSGIVVIEDDLKIDLEKELEERKAYLEESRSQDASE